MPNKIATKPGKKDKEPTDIICILDRSGSMYQLAEEVIGSYNRFIKEQQELDDPATVTLVLFDDKYEMVYEKTPLPAVPELTSETYFVRGWTALNDAIGKTINQFDPKKENVIVLIQTDGAENCSEEYDQPAVKTLVEAREETGWRFIFMGANIDSQQVSKGYGMSRGVSMDFEASASGVKKSYTKMSNATKCLRTNVQINVDEDAKVQVKVKK